MVIVDTSVWIDHLTRSDQQLVDLLERNLVLIHPYIVGELACGNLTNRQEVLKLLSQLPSAITATHNEVIGFIDRHSLMGKGIGYIDCHLLAAVVLSSDAELWTRDKRLKTIAAEMNIAFTP